MIKTVHVLVYASRLTLGQIRCRSAPGVYRTLATSLHQGRNF